MYQEIIPFNCWVAFHHTIISSFIHLFMDNNFWLLQLILLWIFMYKSYIPTSNVRVLVLLYPFQHLVCSILAVLRGTTLWFSFSFSFHDDWWYWASFYMLTCHPYIFLDKYLFKFFSIFYQVVCFLIIEFWNILYILFFSLVDCAFGVIYKKTLLIQGHGNFSLVLKNLDKQLVLHLYLLVLLYFV